MDFTRKVFEGDVLECPIDETQVIFVSDFFKDQYQGGAELTSEALIKSSPYKVCKIRSHEINKNLIENNKEKYWIFGNFINIDISLLEIISRNLHYSIVEYDYKYCKYRTPTSHGKDSNEICNCSSSARGQKIINFFYYSQSVFWMSQAQLDLCIANDVTGKIKSSNNIVLSSAFDKSDIEYIRELRNTIKKEPNTAAFVKSKFWIKGSKENEEWILENGLSPVTISNMKYKDALSEIAKCEYLVFKPLASDTCPRVVIEAKLLGCKLHLNDHVQHAKEEWFNSPVEEIEKYLINVHNKFWTTIREAMKGFNKISGYTQTYNCINQFYPWKESIKSLLGFCDEVIVVDGGSTDGTWEELQKLQNENKKIVIKQIKRDWSSKRFAVYDGMQKAEARKLCRYEFLWQSDVDEIVLESDYKKIKTIIEQFPKNANLLSLPVVEFWGSYDKVRVDTNPWKWRLSRNKKSITHGISKEYRAFDSDGELYSLGSDGCDYIDENTFEKIPSMSFYTNKIEILRTDALKNNDNSLKKYEEWYDDIISKIPTVYHYSWFSIERKINAYKTFWTRFWEALYDKNGNGGENKENVFWGKPWAEISEEEIKRVVEILKKDFGGTFLTGKVDLGSPTPWVTLKIDRPKIMDEWVESSTKYYL